MEPGDIPIPIPPPHAPPHPRTHARTNSPFQKEDKLENERSDDVYALSREEGWTNDTEP